MPRGISSIKEAVKGMKRRASSSVLLSARSSPQQGKDFVTTIPLVDKSDEAEEVDISQFTQEDLERLRVTDPFLYFSIPGNKQWLYDSDKTDRSNTNTRGARRSSCPELGNDDSGSAPAQRRGLVTRVRRLSVEPHPSVVMKNIMDQMMIDDEFDGDTDDEDELLIQAIANTTLITDMQEK
jgi:hypothetical protein